jgi:hypothetical protein
MCTTDHAKNHLGNDKSNKVGLEIPGGEYVESDYSHETPDEAALVVSLSYWDRNVFGVLGDATNKQRNRAVGLLEKFARRSTQVIDLKGIGTITRLHVVKLYQNEVIDYDRDELISYVQQCDKRFNSSGSGGGGFLYSGVASVRMEELVARIIAQSMCVVELERVLRGKQLLKSITPIMEKNEVQYMRGDTVNSGQLSNIGFFLIRELLNQLGHRV